MSRSFGDDIVRPVGVIGDPEIREIELLEQDKFVIMASDGVWEFMSNREVIDIIIPFWEQNNPQKACEAVERESLKRWKENNPSSIDDISMVIFFIDVPN